MWRCSTQTWCGLVLLFVEHLQDVVAATRPENGMGCNVAKRERERGLLRGIIELDKLVLNLCHEMYSDTKH